MAYVMLYRLNDLNNAVSKSYREVGKYLRNTQGQVCYDQSAIWSVNSELGYLEVSDTAILSDN